MLEKALEHVGMKELSDFLVYRPRKDDNKVKETLLSGRPACRVIKVFGQFSDDDYTIDRNNYWSHKQSFAQQLKVLLNRDVMAIGLDLRWDAEFFHVFPPQGEHLLWYINEDDPSHDMAIMGSLYRCSNVSYLVGDTDGEYSTCIYSLFREFVGPLPVTLIGTGLILGELRSIAGRSAPTTR